MKTITSHTHAESLCVPRRPFHCIKIKNRRINEEYESLLSKIAFFKEHPKVNDKVLDHAVTIAILSSKDKLAHEIPSPLEVDIIRRRIEIFYRTIQ